APDAWNAGCKGFAFSFCGRNIAHAHGCRRGGGFHYRGQIGAADDSAGGRRLALDVGCVDRPPRARDAKRHSYGLKKRWSASMKNPMESVSPAMQEIADKSMQQAKKAFDTYIAGVRRALGALGENTPMAATGVKEVGERALNMAERNIAISFSFARRFL